MVLILKQEFLGKFPLPSFEVLSLLKKILILHPLCLLFLLVSLVYFSALADGAEGRKKREINTKVRGKRKHPPQHFYCFELTQYNY